MEPEVYRKLLLTGPTSREHRAFFARHSRERPSYINQTEGQETLTEDGKAASIENSRQLYDAVLRNDRKTVANLINLRTNISRRFGSRNETPLDAARRLDRLYIIGLLMEAESKEEEKKRSRVRAREPKEREVLQRQPQAERKAEEEERRRPKDGKRVNDGEEDD